MLVRRFTSQPFGTALSQLPKPVLQLETRQALAVQPGVPFAVVQALPQKPQLPTEVVMFVSQKSARLPSHSPSPAGHGEAWHAPSTQIMLTPHGAPQPPQCSGLSSVLVSQPLFGSLSQSSKPVEHAGMHVPAAQPVVPFALVQTVPHAPQSVTVVVLVSQPLTGLVSQSAKPAPHIGMHKPLAHMAVPFGFAQVVMQLPHVWGCEEVLASQPLVGVPSQSA